MSNVGTSSLGFAAFLLLRGYKLVKQPEKVEKTSAKTQETKEKYSFQFDMTQIEMNQLYDTFVVSDYYNYDSILHKLRKDISKSIRSTCVSHHSK